jgi:hypothetical protein
LLPLFRFGDIMACAIHAFGEQSCGFVSVPL